MTATQGKLAGLSRFIFRTPRWYTSISFALLVAAVTGLGVFDTQFLLDDMWQGLFFIGVPTVAASFATSAVDRTLGGQLTPNRSSLLALACELAVVGILLVAWVVATLTTWGQHFVFDALLVALAAIFAVRLLVVMAVSRHSILVAAIPAGVQTAVAAVLLFVYSGTTRFIWVNESTRPFVEAYLVRSSAAPSELLVVVPGDFPRLALLCLGYGVAVLVFVRVIDYPWQRSLGVSVLDFVSGFVGHIAEGTDELEAFFEEIGEEAVVPVTVLTARRRDGTEKARFVLPMIHPGPMGEIGGGNLPNRVAEQAGGVCFPPHATAGHDFNLVTDREVDTILAEATRACRSVDYGTAASESVRVESGDATVLAQAIGDSLVVVNTFAPNFADDVEFGVGMSAIAGASGEFEEVLLVDAHNCNNGLSGEDLGHVVPGSTRAFDLRNAVSEAAQRLSGEPQKPLSVGVAWDQTDWSPEDGIGPLGVRVAVFEVGGQSTAYVLVDGNNMVPGVRGRILEAVEAVEAVDVAEAMTTDTHVVNRVDAENQVGANLAVDRLLERVTEVTERAVADREPVEAGMASEHARVTVFGNDRTETLASHANVMVSMGSALAVVVCLVLASFSMLILLFV